MCHCTSLQLSNFFKMFWGLQNTKKLKDNFKRKEFRLVIAYLIVFPPLWWYWTLNSGPNAC
jgi:hypothetical protein